VVGFAAETEDVVSNAREKLERKGLDLIVANVVPSSFGGEISEAAMVEATGATQLEPCTKAELAAAVVDRLVLMLQDAGDE
jgi:phosphopantothenoylcysteine decarboxylase/phosphopantothenate--cysteine ligase